MNEGGGAGRTAAPASARVEPPRDRDPVDPDFAAEVLRDLYRYRRKRRSVAWLLWALLGWAGAHRFYVDRTGTAVLMLFTGGGGLIWWLVDAWLIGSMVRRHNEEQARRERVGEPPLELEFMPPPAADVLRGPPDWAAAWRARSRLRRALRLCGDIGVLVVAGWALGALADTEGAGEAMAAILALIAVTMLGGIGAGRLRDVPLVGGLVAWSHRLRLFYYADEPGNPLALLLRGLTGAVLAPFRKKDRAEVRLYLELGFAFTLAFALLDLVPDLVLPLLRGTLDVEAMIELWVTEAAMTFALTYAFAAPMGAVLTLYLLTRRSHALTRALSAVALAAIGLGMATS